MTATGPQRVETPPTALHSTARGHAAAASCGAPPPAALSPSPPPNSPSFIGRRGRRRGGRRRGGRRTRGGAGTARGDLGLRGRAGGTDALQVVFHVDGRPVGGERAEEEQGTKKKKRRGHTSQEKKKGGKGWEGEVNHTAGEGGGCERDRGDVAPWGWGEGTVRANATSTGQTHPLRRSPAGATCTQQRTVSSRTPTTWQGSLSLEKRVGRRAPLTSHPRRRPRGGIMAVAAWRQRVGGDGGTRLRLVGRSRSTGGEGQQRQVGRRAGEQGGVMTRFGEEGAAKGGDGDLWDDHTRRAGAAALRRERTEVRRGNVRLDAVAKHDAPPKGQDVLPGACGKRKVWGEGWGERQG